MSDTSHNYSERFGIHAPHSAEIDGKVKAGVPAGEIVANELALAGFQRPIAVEELGPGAVEVLRFGDFAGWVIPAGY